jgi:DNA-binding NtrC family response regulator
MAVLEFHLHETGGSPVHASTCSRSFCSTKQKRPIDDGGACTPEAPTVLWIDDVIDDATVKLLGLDGLRIEGATTGSSGLARARSRRFDAYVIDLQLPDMYGLTVLDRLVAEGNRAPALVLTGCYTEYESEKLARQLGAAAFRCKPIAPGDLAATLKSMIETGAQPRLTGPSDLVPERVLAAVDPEPRFGIVAASAAMRSVIEWIEDIAPTTMSVLLTGETGTGKELVARALHERSVRRHRAFVAINCSAIPEGLLEAELFGHKRGAFTGAFQDKKGLLEQAAEGTVFLDEIGDMALPAQSRLLRFLEDGELRRVGDTRTKRIDVRVVAATNRSLVDECAQGRFRRDLYFRLAVARRHLPALRERPEDIDALVKYFLNSDERKNTVGKRVRGISPAGLALLRSHTWPGNVRELRNAIQYAAAVSDKDEIPDKAVVSALSCEPAVDQVSSGDTVAQRTLSALQKNHWNRTRTARFLGINRTTLWRRLRKLGAD